MDRAIYVQFGCGFSAPEAWLNFDSSPTLRFERIPLLGRLYTRKSKDKLTRFPKGVRYGDIVKGLPLNDNTVAGIYSSHVLEHLAYQDGLKALQHSYDLLKTGGIFRAVLPDFEGCVKTYLANTNSDAVIEFCRTSHMCKETRPKTLKAFIFEWLSNSQHLWMWDYKGLAMVLEEIGFTQIRRAYFGDSKDPHFNLVEDKTRWDQNLGVEAVKR